VAIQRREALLRRRPCSQHLDKTLTDEFTGETKMRPATIYTLSLDALRLWSMFAWKTGAVALASVQVIGHRSDRMLSAGASPVLADRRELALMGQEKIAAGAESAKAMALGWMCLNQQLGAIAFKQMLAGTASMLSLATSRTPGQSIARQTRLVGDTIAQAVATTSQLSKSTARLAHRGLKPIHSRATGNAKRLGKHK